MLFGDRLPLAEEFAESLADQATLRGLIGPRELPRLWERHLLNCAAVAELIPEGAAVADLGSGAGLPGVCLAIRRPDLSVTLVEPLLRRTTYLDEVVDHLGLDRVTVHRGRAESLHGKARFDVVTSRALAPLTRLMPWSEPLVATNGIVLAMKGATAADEVADLAAESDRYATWAFDVLRVGADLLDPAVVVVRGQRTG